VTKFTKVDLKLVACLQHCSVSVVESVGVFNYCDILYMECLVTDLDFSHCGFDQYRRSKSCDSFNTAVSDLGKVNHVVNTAALHSYIYVAFKVRVSGQVEGNLNFCKRAYRHVHVCNAEAMAIPAKAGVDIVDRSLSVTSRILSMGEVLALT